MLTIIINDVRIPIPEDGFILKGDFTYKITQPNDCIGFVVEDTSGSTLCVDTLLEKDGYPIQLEVW